MLWPVIRRISSGLAAVLLASLLAFLILEASPGDVLHTLLGDEATQEQEAFLRSQLGLDQLVLIRYARYMGNLLRGDLGVSLINGRPVAQLIGQRFLNTLILASVSMILAVAAGFVLGVWAAVHHLRLPDLAVVLLSALIMAVPSFALATWLTDLFSIRLGWLPTLGGGSAAHFILPCVTLALPTAAVITRVVRAKMLEEINKAYALTALAKGLSLSQVRWRHVLRNALVPALTVIGVQFGNLLGGAFIVETIFAWPGLGRLTVQAIFDQDYPVVMGAVVLSAVLFQLCNAWVDIAHLKLDPGIQEEAGYG